MSRFLRAEAAPPVEGDGKGGRAETFVDYFAELSDGINSDLKDLMETSSRFVKFLFPAPAPNKSAAGAKDSIADLEDENCSNGTKGGVSRMLSSADSAVRRNQVDAALRMRCPSKWSEKDNRGDMLAKVTPQQKKKEPDRKRISLTKLASHKDIVHFPCSDDRIAIIGNKRLMVAKKDNEHDNTATEEWYVFLDDIESCVLNFTSSLLSKSQA